MNNVYFEPDYLDVKADMHKKLQDLRDRYGDSKELQNKYLQEYLQYQERKGVDNSFRSIQEALVLPVL